VDERGEGEADVRSKLEELAAKAHDRAAESAEMDADIKKLAKVRSLIQRSPRRAIHHIRNPQPWCIAIRTTRRCGEHDGARRGRGPRSATRRWAAT